MRRLLSYCLAITLSAGILGQAAAQQHPRFITVGTGGVTGVYYSVGGAICQLVNQQRAHHGLRCSVEATPASQFNLEAVLRGDMDFGLAQSGLQHAAYNGSGVFTTNGPRRNLRSLFSLHRELVTIVTSKQSNARRVEDLRGKRFNIGIEGSGTRIGAIALIRQLGMRESDFGALAALKPDAQADALCAGQIDAFFYMIGHPVQNVSDAVTKCHGRILQLAGPSVDAMVRANPYYVHGSIPAGTYPGQPEAILSYGVTGTMVVKAEMPAEIVYQLVKSVFDNFEEFTELHPALAGLQPKAMIRDGLTAPLHEGAVRYYKERGWL